MNNNNRTRNNNTTRSRKGQRQDRRQAVSTQNDRVLTRKFVENELIFLNNAIGNNSVFDRSFQWAGTSLQGFSTISAGFDQYRIKRIQIYVSPSVSPPAGSVLSSLIRQPVYSCASTTVYSAVDVTGGPSAQSDIFAYQNCEFRTPHPYNAIKVADFTPKLAQTTGLVFPNSTWVSCQAAGGQLWNGLQMRIVNSQGTLVFPQPTAAQYFNIRSVVHVEFRHPIYDVVTMTVNKPDSIEGEPAMQTLDELEDGLASVPEDGGQGEERNDSVVSS